MYIFSISLVHSSSNILVCFPGVLSGLTPSTRYIITVSICIPLGCTESLRNDNGDDNDLRSSLTTPEEGMTANHKHTHRSTDAWTEHLSPSVASSIHLWWLLSSDTDRKKQNTRHTLSVASVKRGEKGQWDKREGRGQNEINRNRKMSWMGGRMRHFTTKWRTYYIEGRNVFLIWEEWKRKRKIFLHMLVTALICVGLTGLVGEIMWRQGSVQRQQKSIWSKRKKQITVLILTEPRVKRLNHVRKTGERTYLELLFQSLF